MELNFWQTIFENTPLNEILDVLLSEVYVEQKRSAGRRKKASISFTYS